ncbi:uncharacterized protein LOC133496974 [Syngnathoides biaculeatus]|uniref:uncharacterized protein LOC133496974 n=1 Tax=Syngnathoides biaculeatus TaxID=300417 RepID=UPI002ADE56D4|nr:uncharacterized protein LOC133496974 [Syngnathoides biaculeatus]
MLKFSCHLLVLRVFISCVGLVGNVFLIFCIIQTKTSSIKTFELFLLGLATANLEEIAVVNIYDFVILQRSYVVWDVWLCRSLKFLMVLGEISSILFTVLIGVYRYQKLRDANKRLQIPIYLDNIRAARKVIQFSIGISILLSAPVFSMEVPGPTGNLTGNHTWNQTGCQLDFFLCSSDRCPSMNRIYKYAFILLCYLLPLVVVTLTSCLIVAVLLGQRTAVKPVASVSGSTQTEGFRKVPRFHRSTVAVLAAMVLFQLDWTLYLVLQMVFNTTDFTFWIELEFFLSTSYTSISPYALGIGKSFFAMKNFWKN